MEDEEKEAIRQALLLWKNEGFENPTIPVFDEDNRSTLLFGLTDSGQLMEASGNPESVLAYSVSESTGEGSINE